MSGGERGEKAAREKITRKESNIFSYKNKFQAVSSIQGEIEWLNQDRKQVRPFRSFLEMITLISDALETIGYPDSEYSLRKWQENDEKLNDPII